MDEDVCVRQTGVCILCRESSLSSGFHGFDSLHTEETNKVKNNQWLGDTVGCFSQASSVLPERVSHRRLAAFII